MARKSSDNEEYEEEGAGPHVRRRWFKYAGIKPERSRGRVKSPGEEVASLSNLEAEAMDILWDLGRPASAMEVLEFSLYKRREQGEEPVSFPALQSTLRRLAEKNILGSDRDDYRTIRYAPTVRPRRDDGAHSQQRLPQAAWPGRCMDCSQSSREASKPKADTCPRTSKPAWIGSPWRLNP